VRRAAATLALAGVLVAVRAEALMLCTRGGGVFARDACRRNERPADLSALGPLGPTGAPGETGPTGTPLLRVVDAVGTTIGPIAAFLPSFADVDVTHPPLGEPVAVFTRPRGFQEAVTSAVAYGTSDCSGPPYVWIAATSYGRTRGTVLGTHLYYPGGTSAPLVYSSYEFSEPDGSPCVVGQATGRETCCLPTPSPTSADLAPAVRIAVSELGFTIPFHVETTDASTARMTASAGSNAAARGRGSPTAACAGRAGGLALRARCRRDERALALADLGVAGPQGPPGAPGRPPVHLFDTADHVVGPVVWAFSTDATSEGAHAYAVFRHAVVGGDVLVGARGSGEALGHLWYETTDCSGAAFVEDGDAFLPVLQILGTAVFRAGQPAGPVTVRGRETDDHSLGCDSVTPHGGCCRSSVPLDLTLLWTTSQTTLDAIGLTPPFHTAR
jgi:hypothetical protein